jgi:ankyrin repeat protein
LQVAVAKSNPDFVLHLLTKGQSVDPKLKVSKAIESSGDTALHLAVQVSCYEAVCYLCKFGADVFKRNNQNQTPFTQIQNNLLLLKLLKKQEK